MTDPDRESFVRLLNLLAASRPSAKAPDEAMLEAYWLGLEDVSLPAFAYAVKDALRDPDPFFPTPGQLRAVAKACPTSCYSLPPRQMDPEEAKAAYQKVVELARRLRRMPQEAPVAGWSKPGPYEESGAPTGRPGCIIDEESRK